jgi:outer membrane protein
MAPLRLLWLALCLPVCVSLAAGAQHASGQLRAPRGLQDYVVNNQLRLALADAVRLMLLNNASIRVEQQSVEQTRVAVTRAYAPFDPAVSAGFSSNRQTTPTTSQLQGASTLSTLLQDSQAGYQETFSPGTMFQSQFTTSRTSTNSVYNFFNPSLLSALSFSLAQPLLRNRGRFVNRAPIRIAQTNLEQSQFQFQQQINDAIQQVTRQYWQVVLDRENLQVLKQSLEAAEASYNHDKRALELGALSPLDIYQSEAEVATRRIALIQSQYSLKQDVDQLRLTLGADLDPAYQSLDLDLIETPKPSSPLLVVDVNTAIKEGLEYRPELRGLEQQLRGNEISIRLAENHLLPDLQLSAQYSTNGLGGNQLSSTSQVPTILARGGLGDALGQVFGFGFPGYGFTLQLNFPVRNHTAAANLAEARVSDEQTLYQIRRTQEQVRLDVEDAVNQLNQAKLSISAAQAARDLAQKNVEAQQRKYELGSGLMFLVLQAQTQLAQAESSLVQAQVNYQLAVTALDHATAALIGRYHVQIAQAIP